MKTALIGSTMFQSAPRAGARGDTLIPYFLTIRQKFQSAPRAGARGDPNPPESTLHYARFNPLPARVRGEITQNGETSYGIHVSIRSPRGCAGRCRLGFKAKARRFCNAFARTGRAKGLFLIRMSKSLAKRLAIKRLSLARTCRRLPVALASRTYNISGSVRSVGSLVP